MVFTFISSIICDSCGIIKNIQGIIVDDDIYYNNDGKCIKQCVYDSSRHCRFWVSKIFKKGSLDVNEKDIIDIKKKVDELRLNVIKCDNIREVLKES